MDGLAQVQSRIAEIRASFPALPTSAPAPVAAAPAGSFAEVLTAAQTDAATPSTSAAAVPAGAGSVTAEGKAVAEARKYLGIPYAWGGTNPDVGLDCSGFTQLVYKGLGIDIPRVSSDQAKAGRPVASVAQARPGDLVFYDYSSSRSGIDHVGIYIGNGKIINAPKPGDVVKIADVGTPVAIRRLLPPGGDVAARPGAGGVAGAAGAVGALPSGTSVPFANLFTEAGARHGVPPALLAAVAKTESGFNPNAVSGAGAQGLMQFMPATARGMGINPLNPAQAVDGAARYLAANLREFGSVDKALAAYNAGPGTVRRYGGVPPYEETQNYVRLVNSAWRTYR